MTATRTTVALLTPPGRSALAALALRGPSAWDAVRAIFTPRRGELPDAPEPGRHHLGKVGGDTGDDAVLVVRAADSLELHTHGGKAVASWVMDLLTERGLDCVEWLAPLSLLEAITANVLAHTPTVRTAAIALDQHGGALRRALEAMRDAVDDSPALSAIRRDLERWSALGAHLATPWRVVLAGPPNVGKSSLLNALAGFQRSIVAATPGTTRDVVTATLAIDGWPIEFSDTAGLREVGESLESQGIDRAREAIADADLCLWLLDASEEPVWPDEVMNDVRLVVNKIDRPAAWDLSRAGEAPRVSATTGAGLSELCQTLSRWLVPEVPPPGTAVPLGMEMRAICSADGEELRAALGRLLRSPV